MIGTVHNIYTRTLNWVCVFFIFGGLLDLRQIMGLGDLCALNGRFSSFCL